MDAKMYRPAGKQALRTSGTIEVHRIADTEPNGTWGSYSMLRLHGCIRDNRLSRFAESRHVP